MGLFGEGFGPGGIFGNLRQGLGDFRDARQDWRGQSPFRPANRSPMGGLGNWMQGFQQWRHAQPNFWQQMGVPLRPGRFPSYQAPGVAGITPRPGPMPRPRPAIEDTGDVRVFDRERNTAAREAGGRPVRGTIAKSAGIRRAGRNAPPPPKKVY